MEMILATDFGIAVPRALIGCILRSLSLAIWCLPQLPDKLLVHHISTRPNSSSKRYGVCGEQINGWWVCCPNHLHHTRAGAPRRRRETVGHYQHAYPFLDPRPTTSGSTRVALFAESCASLLYRLGPRLPAFSSR
jgi:hypothetical protein